MLAKKEQLATFIFQKSFLYKFSLRIWRLRLTAKNVSKLSLSRLRRDQKEKILDPLFLSNIGLIKPKTLLSL
jgi:hypothetical protein